MTNCSLVYITAATREEAQLLARTVVAERLAACANLLGPIESYYHWEGKFEVGSESLVILKTTRDQVPALTERLRCLHSYSCPAIVAMPIEGGHAAFLDWIRDEVASPRSAK